MNTSDYDNSTDSPKSSGYFSQRYTNLKHKVVTNLILLSIKSIRSYNVCGVSLILPVALFCLYYQFFLVTS